MKVTKKQQPASSGPVQMHRHEQILRFILHRRNPMFFKSTEHGMVAMVSSSCVQPETFKIHDSSTEFTLQDAMDSEAKLPDVEATEAEDSDVDYYIEEYPAHSGLLKIPTQDESLHHKYGRHHSPNVVSFGKVRICYHNLILGDSPGVSTGPPIALGNECVDEETADAMEQDGPPEQHATWGGDDPMRIPAGIRRNMLIDQGVSVAEIKRYDQYVKLYKKNPYHAARIYPDFA